MSDLLPLIEQVKAAKHDYVVVTISVDGIRWRDQTESACNVMANILGNCKVMTRENFVKALEEMVVTVN